MTLPGSRTCATTLLAVWLTGCVSTEQKSKTADYEFITAHIIYGSLQSGIDDLFYLGTVQTGKLADAAGRGDTHKMQQLVGEGAIVDGVGAYGMTPLLWSINKRNLDGFKWLLEHNANPNLVSCCDAKQLDSNPMEIAAALSNSEYLELLLSHGGDVNLRSGPQQQTPLFAAIAYHRTENIKLLIRNHADVNAAEVNSPIVGGYAHTPLSDAMGVGQYEIAILLLQAGADACAKDALGHSVAYEMSTHANIGVTDADRKVYPQIVERLKPLACSKNGP